VGACAFAFSGTVLSLGSLINLLDGAAFLPLTLWLACRAMTRRFAPWGPLAALSLAVQILAGEPAILLATAVAFAALHASFPRPSPGALPPARRAAGAAAIVALAGALAMAGLLPGVEMLSRSERGAGFEAAEAMKWSLPPMALAEVAVRGVFGDPSLTRMDGWWGGRLHDTGLPFLLSLYLGPGILLLAGAGLAAGWRAGGSRRAESWLHGGLALAGVLLALGRFLPLYPALVALVPPAGSVRYPAKYALIFTWAAAVLAARGYDALASRSDRPLLLRPALQPEQRRALLAGAVLSLAAMAIGYSGALGWTARFAGEATAGAPADMAPAVAARMDAALLEAGLVAAVLAAAALARLRTITPALLAFVPIAMLVISGVRVNPVTSSDFYTRRPALLDRVATGTGSRVWAEPRPRGFAFRTPEGPGRDSLAPGFLWDRMTLRNATSFPLGVRHAYDRGNERLDIMPGAAVGRLLAERAAAGRLEESDARLLAVAGVGSVVHYGAAPQGWTETSRLEGESNIPVTILSVPRPLPRVLAVLGAEIQPEPDRALRRLQDPGFDPFTTVLLEEGDPAPRPSEVAAASDAVPRAAIMEESSSTVRVSAWLPAEGHVVLADTHYPGWVARVDGEQRPIVRANVMFRAVRVPAGSHEITFAYEPATVRNGCLVSGAAVLLAALLAVPRRP
jgi:hypothetical protein